MPNNRTIKNNRKGLSIVELTKRFPDEEAARVWFEEQRWGKKRVWGIVAVMPP